MIIPEKLHRLSLQVEQYAPQIRSRVWGLCQDPMAQLMGLQVTKLTENQIEVSFKNLEGTASRFVLAAETALGVLWKRHLSSGGHEKVIFSQCSFQLVRETNLQHFV